MAKKKNDQTRITWAYPTPKKMVVNGPATIVFWSDGTKTIAKCCKDEPFDPEKGVAIAIAKKFVPSNTRNKMFDDAHSLINDGGIRGLLAQWQENMRILANFYGHSAGGNKK